MYFRIFVVPEVCVSYRLLQTILFLRDSVFRVLFAYNMPMHRKYVRLRCVCHVFYDALFALVLSFM